MPLTELCEFCVAGLLPLLFVWICSKLPGQREDKPEYGFTIRKTDIEDFCASTNSNYFFSDTVKFGVNNIPPVLVNFIKS